MTRFWIDLAEASCVKNWEFISNQTEAVGFFVQKMQMSGEME